VKIDLAAFGAINVNLVHDKRRKKSGKKQVNKLIKWILNSN
jgi:hypothetical protein